MPEWVLSAKAPSNIALIKYMGKKDSSRNLPENGSLSLTLNSLCSLAEISSVSGGQVGKITWVPEKPRRIDSSLTESQLQVPQLDERGLNKVTRHFERVRNEIPKILTSLGISHSEGRIQKSQLILRTANTFPAASGIASSASSFAAMTLGMGAVLVENEDAFHRAWVQEPRLRQAFARVSRMGSGSSCRSFEGPWVFWEEEDAAAIKASQMPKMAHFVVLVRTTPKKVSSSDAHTLVKTSPLWQGRVDRVSSRIQRMILSLEKGDLETAARISWSEAWEMHSLFHTCAEPFTYWEPGTIEVLQWFSSLIREPSPPIVTLDAGPNIHVIVEKSVQSLWRARLKERFPQYGILEDEPGEGAGIQSWA
jgi:diphosphomevalonate decarboxylase